jgi:ribonucleoside-diphosphate reductase alpha chain
MKGLTIKRFFTEADATPYSLFDYEKRDSIIKNPDGSVVFEIKDVEVPKQWSQLATDILAQKYIRKAGVPQEDGTTGSEQSIKQVVNRLAGCWRHWGEKYGYFASEEDAQAFYDEIAYMLLNQMVAPNSPQWFNTGLAWAYNIRGNPQGHWFIDPESGEMKQSDDAYTRPQPHACFIQSLSDDLVNEGGIFDLALREARVFKYGSGTGSNFSNLRGRGEPLSGGGTSSGLMSFLKVFDAGAGAIKSGGTTRRAAKMVCLDMDHPEIETFIMWKYREEQKVADLVTGSQINKRILQRIADVAKEGGADWKENKELKVAIKEAKALGVSMNYIFRILQLAEQGIYDADFLGFDTHYESEAYQTVSGQNANNSVRIPNSFLEAVENDSTFDLIKRTDGGVWRTVNAKELWEKVCLAAWHSADPGVQYDTTINEWHTCPKDGKINASNPCSEYMFLDDTACNLASLNIAKFLKGTEFDTDAFRHASRLMTIVLEISVLMAQFVSKEMALRSHKYRTLGLGYANIGSTLMRLGIPYDSDEARAYIGCITAIMCGQAYETSAELAEAMGAFEGYESNKEDMLRVIKNHRRAAYAEDGYEGLTVTPQAIDADKAPEKLVAAARTAWDDALKKGEEHGYRNAQVTVIAPTGTIGLIMDCDTTGIEPDFALVKFKKLAGGGYFKIINQGVPLALEQLGYSAEQTERIIKYAVGHGTLKGSPALDHAALEAKGFTAAMIETIEQNLETAFDITFVFNRYTLGEAAMETLGVSKEEYEDPSFNLLRHLGFTKEEIEQAGEYVCGTMTLEGAPGLKEEHLPVFDCASKCGRKGKRFLSAEAHIRAMAAAQPFISGAISKTINMPNEAKIDDIGAAYLLSWKLMVKANALYRDGSKLSQPLNTVAEELSAFDADEEDTLGPEVVQRSIAASFAGTPEWEGVTREATIAGSPVSIVTHELENGALGHVEMKMDEMGDEYQGMLDAYTEMVNHALMSGIPLQNLVDKFTFADFAPGGPVQGDSAIKNATSPVDYLFRVLGHEYLGMQELVHNKEAAPTRAKRERKKRSLTEEELAIAEAKAKQMHQLWLSATKKNTW